MGSEMQQIVCVAIINRNLAVVLLVLRTYSKILVQFTGETTEALVRHPNLNIVQALYDYNFTIVFFEWDNSIDTFVTKACKQPPEKITALLQFLIKHDANLKAGYFPKRMLCHAISGDQTPRVIEAMVDKGTILSTHE